mmetsp:Transcript_5689/g.11937  ORF Transcript_5689/g.11937 Transcript_5689/m.11937 type:complete len:227 (+) Transcript_5689:61-741(+)|eukprot:CAMPEP_0194310768 /NCGR_PEP_ID=MMETSP0171-20130528/7751_1 /TAXON_ID=218684 /ORGANISM="Corethron pennatum, Strain L29A3" /LENGTH=226 /DNA_ID=CAMNT_0039064567 /DNA_START=36 /DNA_END=716 /DNA_ORIENTATION=-
MAIDGFILNYNDAVIYQRDISLLENEDWINDACINFQLRRLQSIWGGDSGPFLFLDPSVVSFLMHQCDDDEEFDEVLSAQRLDDRKRIFVPVNDNNAASLGCGSGSHWSLLVVMIDKNMSLHFDSAGGSNEIAAKAVAKKLSYAMFPDRRCAPIDVEIKSCSSPQQENSYDCGLYMLAASEAIAKTASNQIPDLERFVADATRDPSFAKVKRKLIADDIREIAART